jgi:hypothetical protein
VNHLRQSGVSAGLQTVYSLPSWPACKFALIGGGAVGYRTPLENIRARYGCTPERVAFLGVDFNDDAAVVEHAEFLRQTTMITCRSRAQAERIGQLIGRSDIRHHPDLVFGFRPHANPDHANSKQCGPPILGVNCTDFFWKRSGDSYVPGWKWSEEAARRSPHLAPWLTKLGTLYVNAFGSVLDLARQAGWSIWHVPFKSLDDHFARYFFSAKIDRFLPYTSNPHSVYQTFGRFAHFLPTRFHSLVFAMITSTPVVPFCYAEKSEQLCSDFGLTETQKMTAIDLATNAEKLTRLWDAAIKIDGEVLQRAQHEVADSLQSASARIKARI